MAAIPAGTFWMGCNSVKDSSCQSAENQQHKVNLSGYFIDLTETTVAAYKACVDGGPCTAPDTVNQAQYVTYPSLSNHPVNNVTWVQSQQYCQWRGAGFDLPTEAQWEMAARGRCEENGSTAADASCKTAMRTYPWGEPTATCSYAVMYNGSLNGCGTNATATVGAISAGDSPFALHDMAGNVSEWCRDWYETPYSSVDQVEPSGPATGTARAARNGGFAYSDLAWNMRTSWRYGAPPSQQSVGLGFRCTRALSP